jgi:hypothetical protein
MRKPSMPIETKIRTGRSLSTGTRDTMGGCGARGRGNGNSGAFISDNR